MSGETIADIIAEARDKYTVHECNQCAWRKCCSKGFGSEECGKLRESIWLKLGIEDGYFTQLLDRLGAAHKRERAAIEADALEVGGIIGATAAKLREALKQAKEIARTIYSTSDKGSPHENLAEKIVEIISTALAAPPRNCDVGTPDEQLDRWQAFCNKWGDNCTGCPCEGFGCTFAHCYSKWAQMPYEGGGAK